MIILLDQTIKYGVQANFMKISERKKKYLTNSISQFIFIFILSLKLNWALKSLSLTYIAKSGLIKTYDICCYFYFWWLIRCILFIFYLPYLLIFLYIILSVRYCMWIDKNKKNWFFYLNYHNVYTHKKNTLEKLSQVWCWCWCRERGLQRSSQYV